MCGHARIFNYIIEWWFSRDNSRRWCERENQSFEDGMIADKGADFPPHGELLDVIVTWFWYLEWSWKRSADIPFRFLKPCTNSLWDIPTLNMFQCRLCVIMFMVAPICSWNSLRLVIKWLSSILSHTIHRGAYEVFESVFLKAIGKHWLALVLVAPGGS